MTKQSAIIRHLRTLGLRGRELDEAAECAMRYSLSQVLDWTGVRVQVDDMDPNTPVRVFITDEDGEHIDRFEREIGWVS